MKQYTGSELSNDTTYYKIINLNDGNCNWHDGLNIIDKKNKFDFFFSKIENSYR